MELKPHTKKYGRNLVAIMLNNHHHHHHETSSNNNSNKIPFLKDSYHVYYVLYLYPRQLTTPINKLVGTSKISCVTQSKQFHSFYLA